MMKSIVQITILIGTSALLSAAQALPDISQAVKESQQGLPNPSTSVPLPDMQNIPQLKPPMKDISGKKIAIKGFQFSGNTAIDSTELQSMIQSYSERDLNFAEIEEIVSIITKAYRIKGFFVARAYVPVQTIRNGILEIAIIEGRYGEIRVKNLSRVKSELIEEIFNENTPKGGIVQDESLEKAMLIVNDLSGAIVSESEIAPGDKVGSSNFAVTIGSDDLVNGYALMDNYGSKYTGVARFSVGADINSPTSAGDKLALNGMYTATGGLLNGRIGYTRLLTPHGLQGEIALSRTTYSLGSDYAYIEASGFSNAADIVLSYPLVKKQSYNLTAWMDIGHKLNNDQIKSTSTDTRKELTNITVGLKSNYVNSFLGARGKGQISTAFTYGDLNIKSEDALLADQSGGKTNGTYEKVFLSMMQTVAFDNELQLSASVKAQFGLGNKNLDPSEQFTISGTEAVRAFPISQFSAENGYVATIELSQLMAPIGDGEVQNYLSLFVDQGRAYRTRAISDVNDMSIADMGIGISTRYQNFNSRIQMAKTIGGQHPIGEYTSTTRFLAQLGWIF